MHAASLHAKLPLALLCAALAAAAGCDSPGGDAPGGGQVATDLGAGPDASGGDVATPDAGPTADAGPKGDTGTTTPDAVNPPVEGEPAALRPYSGGTCPTLSAGANSFLSSGTTRSVQVALPSDPTQAGVLFVWHGFGDSGANMATAFGGASTANQLGVILVSADAAVDPWSTEKLAPYAEFGRQMMGPLPLSWSVFDGPDPDVTLFDDLLACLAAQYDIDRTRVATLGFSAGALWSTRLVLERADYLAAAVLFSGGLGSSGGLVEVVRIAYATPAHRVPVLAVGGGPTDLWPNEQTPLVDFQAGTEELRAALLGDGHAVVSCDHTLGHTVPSELGSKGLDYVAAHTFGDDTPYRGHDGAGWPSYCAFPAP